MQGQGSSSNSYANFGLTQQQLEILHQFWLFMNSNHDVSVPNGHNSLNGTTQSSSSTNNQDQTRFISLLNEINENPFGRGQRLEGIHSENGQVGDGPPIALGNIDVNVTYEGNSNYLAQQMGTGLSLHLSKPGGQEADRNPSAINSSNPLSISSGIARYVLEENDGRQGNGRRLSCKRRMPEDVSRQLLLGSSSSSAQQARNSEQTDIFAQENAIISGALIGHANLSNLGQLEAGLGVGVGVGVGRGANSANREITNVEGTVLGAGIGAATVNHQSSSVIANRLLQGSSLNGLGPASGIGAAAGMMHQASIRARQTEVFQRNIRSRRNANQQDFLPASLSTWNTMNSSIQSLSQTAMFFPHDHFLNPNLPPQVEETPTMTPFMQVPNPFQTLQLSQGVNMPTAQESTSSSVLAGNRRDAQLQEGHVRNNTGDIFLHPELELGEFSHMTTNLNLANGNMNFPGNAPASSSRDGPNRRPYVPTWFSNPIFREQNTNGLNIASSSESQRQNNFPRPVGAAVARREMENSVRGHNNTRPRLRLRRSRLMPSAEVEDSGYLDIHPALQSSSPRRRGRQLLSENGRVLLRRGGGLRFEDFEVIDNSVLFRLPEDVHEDMRLDIDDMTYEELLALGEDIGHVCTGLNEKHILTSLRLHKHQPVKDGSTVNDDPCCICQEEYADGEDIGKLDCGHDFHVNCIKQWLMQKNLCPICKKIGLANKQGEHQSPNAPSKPEILLTSI